MSYTGRIEIRAVALEPIHHGQGTRGNTVSARRQEVMAADQGIDTVPFVSGNSIRHMLRDAGIRYALEAMQIPEGSLSKAVVDLLFSGGSLTGKGSLTLAKARRLAELFPILAVLGYSAGSTITGGRIEVWNLHCVCAQNAFRRPDIIPAEDPRWSLEAGQIVGLQFGTRHDAARIPHAAAMLAIEDKAAVEAAGEAKKGKTKEPKPETSTQMIYDYETIMAGTEMFGGIVYRGLKEGEMAALMSALSHACDGRAGDGGYLYTVAAKRGTGHGRMSWHFTGLLRPVATPAMQSSDMLLPALSMGDRADRLDVYRAHLAQHREAIMRELEEIAS